MIGDALDTFNVTDDGPDPLLIRLHQIALVIVALRREANDLLNQVSNADATVDFDTLTALLNQIADETLRFKQVAAQRTAQDPFALSAADRAILSVGTWAQAVLDALPAAVSAIPNAFVNAAGRVIGNAGAAATSAILPWLLGGGLLLLFVTQAEKSRTYRKAVA